MLQTIDGYEVFVVEFDTMPSLPISSYTEKERPFARALQAAILDGVIKEPGKYGIHIPSTEMPERYSIFIINE